jgi:hypothetical protein
MLASFVDLLAFAKQSLVTYAIAQAASINSSNSTVAGDSD